MLTVNHIDNYDILNNPGDSGHAVTVWFSGCSGICKGCHNTSLHDKENGNRIVCENLFREIDRECTIHSTKRVILLGGEPLEQNAMEIRYLCMRLYSNNYKIWLYTRFEFPEIDPRLLYYLDTVKCGQYDKSLRQNDLLASSNQYFMRRYGDNWRKISIIGGNICRST